jgi:hypothetical protein
MLPAAGPAAPSPFFPQLNAAKATTSITAHVIPCNVIIFMARSLMATIHPGFCSAREFLRRSTAARFESGVRGGINYVCHWIAGSLFGASVVLL